MKKLNTFLLVIFALITSLCSGQTILFSENGLSFQYYGSEKIGNRYDEYCKTSFDIYRVKGTVVNKNSDKAAHITAILNFDGHICNKIYSNNGSLAGEIINKVYSLDISLQTKSKAKYWVNRLVQLLPEDEITAYGYVEVKQGEPCPEPNHYFTYEFVDSKGNLPASKPEEITTVNAPTKTNITATNTNNYNTLILGKWTRIHLVNTMKTTLYPNGIDESLSEPGYYLQFNSNGEFLNWGDGKSDAGSDNHWSINGNTLIYTSLYGTLNKEILFLDKAKLVIKTTERDGNNYVVVTYKKMN